MSSLSSFAPRLLAGFGTAALVGAVGLFASSRPAHTAGGPVPVAVSNLPLPTTPTDEAAPRQPFQARTEYVISNGDSFGSLSTIDGSQNITVPTGKRLVIQTVSVYRNGALNGQRVQVYIEPTVNGNFADFALPSVPDDGTGFPGATLSTMLSADPGSLLRVFLFRNGTTGREFITINVSGYLVDAT